MLLTSHHRINDILLSQDTKQNINNQEITIKGWVKTKRESKAGITFIQINDGSCQQNLQIVAANKLDNYSIIQTLTTGCAISATGKLVESQGKKQSIELQASEVTLIGDVDNPGQYPIQPKRHSMEYLREVAHLRPRTNTFAAVARLRHICSKAIHDYLDKHGFYWINTPIITGNDCEGAGQLFRVTTLDPNPKHNDYSADFFGKETFLTVSGQLNVETYCMALSRVYTFGPTFRAENSNTTRHLAEFWMVEPEMAFVDLAGTATFCEDMLKSVLKTILDKAAAEMEFFNQHIDKDCINRLEQVINQPFEYMTYSKAIELLEKSVQSGKNKEKFEFPVKWGLDLQSEHERYLTEQLCKCPVIVTDYPKDIKGFYMRQNDDNKTVAALDVLVPGVGEIIGGSQREERYTLLEQRMQEMNLATAAYQWYLDLRKYGSVPHSGFGLGLERLLSYISGMSNVRDVIPFPRTPGHAEF